MGLVADHGSASGIDEIPDNIKKIFVTAHDISPEWHIKTQAVFQKYIDNAVSKTVNFSSSATIDDIRKVYDLAYELECKGVTVYRDGSRDSQVLQISSDSKNEDKKDTESVYIKAVSPRPRHETTWGATRKMTTGCGSLYVTINEDEEGIFEVFAAMGKGGGCAASQTEAIGRLISLSLRSGIDRDQIVKQLKGVRCPNQAWGKGGRIYSCSDAIAKALENYTGVNFKKDKNETVIRETAQNIAETNGKGNDNVMTGVCPDCHGPLEFESGCSVCRGCGFSRCG
jgi:ribonucleoside-diphosphate reductase alpha chain